MSKNVWMLSAVFVIVMSVFLGIFISDSSMLSVLGEPVETEQVEIAENPWTQDGSLFTTQVVYVSPAGEETNTIILGVEDDLITSFEMTIDTANDVSKMYQKKFIDEVKELVIGKSISEIAQIDTIAGASVTTDAFRDAVVQF